MNMKRVSVCVVATTIALLGYAPIASADPPINQNTFCNAGLQLGRGVAFLPTGITANNPIQLTLGENLDQVVIGFPLPPIRVPSQPGDFANVEVKDCDPGNSFFHNNNNNFLLQPRTPSLD